VTVESSVYITGAQMFGESTHTNPELNVRAQKGHRMQCIVCES